MNPNQPRTRKSAQIAHDAYLGREQCVAARALLGWSQSELEAASGVSRRTIADFETGARVPHARILRDLREALEPGVVFLDADGDYGPGVRLRARPPAPSGASS